MVKVKNSAARVLAAAVVAQAVVSVESVHAAPTSDGLWADTSEIYARETGRYSYMGPYATGGTAWSKGFAKAKALIDQMTIEEKVSIYMRTRTRSLGILVVGEDD